MNICLICLRTDRRIKHNTVLSEFHDELCGFTLLVAKTFYCSECEYLLTKFYKFKQKCIKASDVYRDWMTGDIKVPIHDLNKLLPPPSLGLWKPNRKTTNISLPVSQTHPKRTEKLNANTTLQELIKNSYIKEVKVEYEPINDKLVKNQENEIIQIKQTDDETCNSGTEEHLDEELDLNLIGRRIDDDELNNSIKSQVITDKCTSKTEVRIDRLEDELGRKLTQFGDIRTEDGVALNKELVTKLMRHKAGRPVISSFWKATFLDDILDLLPVIGTTLNTIKNDEKSKKEVDYSSVFEIEYLSTPEMKLEEFERRKTYECYVKAEHKCEICYQGFKSSKHLEYHTKKWHNEHPGWVLCPICNTWNPKLSSHKFTHVAVYKCKLCPLVTYHRDSMQNHFQQHQGKKYSCEKCNITYKSRSSYLTHVGKHHRQGRNICTRCGRGFVSPLGLRIHKKNSSRCTQYAPTGTEYAPTETGATEPTGGVRCDECDVTLPSQKVYDAHIIDVHIPRRFGGQRLEINSSGLPEFRRLNSHSQKSRAKYTLAKHTCRVCNTVGSTFGWLRLHFKMEHPNEEIDTLYADRKPHLCDVCGAGFSKVYALRDHMNVHTGARPYACDLCTKRFRNANVMKEHRLRHFPSAVTCARCGSQFKTTSNLHTHMKLHIGERIYKCDICGKGFLLSAALNEHIRGVHHNIRRVKKRNKTEVGDKTQEQTLKKTKIVEFDETETNDAEPAEMETKIVEFDEIETNDAEPAEMETNIVEFGEIETNDAEPEEIEIETVEMEIDTEEIENETERCEGSDTEFSEICKVTDTGTIEACEVTDTKTVKTSEDTEMQMNKKKKPFRVVILKGRL